MSLQGNYYHCFLQEFLCDISIILSKSQLSNHIVITNYADVSVDIIVLISKSQSSN
jgi:hypothetical protein